MHSHAGAWERGCRSKSIHIDEMRDARGKICIPTQERGNEGKALGQEAFAFHLYTCPLEHLYTSSMHSHAGAWERG